MIEIKDEHIIELIKLPFQKEKGFSLLLDKYQKPLYFHIRRMLGNHEDTEDVVQEMSIKIWKSIENFRGDSKLYSWLYRIATNTALTFISQKKKLNIQLMADENESDEDFYTNSILQEDQLSSTEIEAHFFKALETLPVRQKLVFNMRYYDELSYEDISAILDTSVGGLKASYHHAVKKIEKYILNHT